MSGDRGDDRLENLLRTMRGAGAAAPVAPVARESAHDTSFATLPHYRQVLLQRRFAETAGLAVPYFRVHETRSGAEAVIEGRTLSNFTAYDYLDLNGHAEVRAAATEAIAAFGTSVSASRLTAGERRIHRALEEALAAVYEADDCVVFNSGHAAGLSILATFLGPRDLVVFDALAHNCITVGAQLCGAARRSFPHGDLDALEALLARERAGHERCLIVSEGLFSMDGDVPDLARLVEIKRRHGAWLMIDDAHGLGVLGRTGRGIFEHAGVEPGAVDLWFGTLSKTLAGCGGYLAGPAAAVDLVKAIAPGFVYSVGMPAATAAASLAALAVMRREPERVARLAANGRRFLKRAKARGLDTGAAVGAGILPVHVGDTARTLVLAERLFEAGINAFPILPPGVPEKTARLRFFVTAAHDATAIDAAVDKTATILAGLGDVSVQSLMGRS